MIFRPKFRIMIKESRHYGAGQLLVNSPTHKWTEGRAPVWGTEFT